MENKGNVLARTYEITHLMYSIYEEFYSVTLRKYLAWKCILFSGLLVQCFLLLVVTISAQYMTIISKVHP